jgi:hypothetical protein
VINHRYSYQYCYMQESDVMRDKYEVKENILEKKFVYLLIGQ